MNPMNNILKSDAIKAIFSTIKNIMVMSKKLCQSLTSRVQTTNSGFFIGDILSEFVCLSLLFFPSLYTVIHDYYYFLRVPICTTTKHIVTISKRRS
jgi:hypothetical protein